MARATRAMSTAMKRAMVTAARAMVKAVNRAKVARAMATATKRAMAMAVRAMGMVTKTQE
jgi:hypothetical protein